MMHYNVFINQNNIEDNHKMAILEYTKRLSAYCDIRIIAGFEQDLFSGCSMDNSHFYNLVRKPSDYNSIEFAKEIDGLQRSGKSNVNFFIGFSDDIIYNLCEKIGGNMESFSLSNCSLSVETQTVLLVEQLYRGYTILQGKTYHK